VTESQAPQETWTRWNHCFQKGTTKDGYAVCILCDTHENEDGIIKPCPKGPVLLEIDRAYPDPDS